jgi:hypothetical protein
LKNENENEIVTMELVRMERIQPFLNSIVLFFH